MREEKDIEKRETALSAPASGSVIVLEEKLNDFMEQMVDGFQLRDPCNFDCTEIVKEPPPKYLFNGKPKRR